MLTDTSGLLFSNINIEEIAEVIEENSKVLFVFWAGLGLLTRGLY